MTAISYDWLLSAYGITRCVIDRLMVLTNGGKTAYSGRFEREFSQFNPRSVVHGLHELREHGVIDFRGAPNIGGRDIWILPVAATWLKTAKLPDIDERGQLKAPLLSPQTWNLYCDLRELTKNGTVEFCGILGVALGRRTATESIDVLVKFGLIENQILPGRKVRRLRVLKVLDITDVVIAAGNVPRGTENKPPLARMKPGQSLAPRPNINHGAHLDQQNAAFAAAIRSCGGRFEDGRMRRKVEVTFRRRDGLTRSPITCTAAMAAI